jgi:hypothetical protein
MFLIIIYFIIINFIILFSAISLTTKNHIVVNKQNSVRFYRTARNTLQVVFFTEV